jgi:hypothetical protein
MIVVAYLPKSSEEFTVQTVVEASEEFLDKPFKTSNAGMMLKTLTDSGFIFRNRRGKYSFAVPLLDNFIKRQTTLSANLPAPFDDPNV